MKAIQVFAPHDVRYGEVAMAEPGPEEVLVRVRATGICRTDVEIVDGSMFYITAGLTTLPLIPGHEWSGEVVEIGRDVVGFGPGDLVTGECSVGCRACAWCRAGHYNHCPQRTETGILNRPGGFADYLAFPAHFLHHCAGLSPEQAATIEPTAVSLFATRQARVTPGDTVAVIGVGAIGLLAVQTARAYGAGQIIAVDLDPRRLQLARALGADVALLGDDPELAAQVRDFTHGRMVDVVLEAAGQPAAFATVQAILAPRARVALLGLTGGKLTAVNMDALVVGGVQLIGSLGSPNVWPEAIALHRRGQIDVASLISHRLPLAQFGHGIELMQQTAEPVVKVMVTPS